MTQRGGRKALSPAMRAATGRPLKKQTDRVPGLSAPTSLPAAPSVLDDAGREEWDRIGRFLVATRRVSELDMQSLTSYCLSWSLFGQSIRPLLIGRKPLWSFVGDAAKPRPSKLEDVARHHALIVIDIARKFGMTARTRHLDHANTGRPALPNELHELRGNPSKKNLKAKFTEQVGDWEPADVMEPYWFDRTARDEWYRLIAKLDKLELWTPLDLAVVAIGCSCWSLSVRAFEQLKHEDPIILGDKGASTEHPLSLIVRRQLEVLDEVWRDFGMSPLDRARFKHAGGDSHGKPKLSVYL